MKSRELEVSVISDLHLATHACKPKKVLKYLKSIHPKTLILNGDIIDSWRFSRNYFPKNHLKVVRQFIKMMEKGVQIFYITGNHDEFLRKFGLTQIGNLRIVNQLVLELDGERTWLLHGDIFDNIIHSTKWLAKLGAAVYGLLTIFNNALNRILKYFRVKEIIIYKSLKRRLNKDKSDLNRFEKMVVNSAVLKNCSTVICGHTHKPVDKETQINGKIFRYLNCGDWVEHFTAAEYYDRKWHLFYFDGPDDELQPDELDIPEDRQLYRSLVNELIYTNIL